MDRVFVNLDVDAEFLVLAERLCEEMGYLSVEDLMQDLLTEATRNWWQGHDDLDFSTNLAYRSFGDAFDEDMPF